MSITAQGMNTDARKNWAFHPLYTYTTLSPFAWPDRGQVFIGIIAECFLSFIVNSVNFLLKHVNPAK
jgi:hypothetical protein